MSPRARTRELSSATRPRLEAGEKASIILVYAAALYPLLLCFVNTRVARMPNAAIVIAEMLIIVAALPILLSRINLAILLLTLCIAANFLMLALFQQGYDLKALRDLLMPLIFVWLGYHLANRHRSEQVLRNLAFIAAGLGLVEFIFPTAFSSFFDTIAFYQARGFGANNPYALTVLQVRPDGIGRSLFPFLGPRRMSSIFLEPVALGNFAVLTAAWALSKSREEWRAAALMMALSGAMLIESDARFGSISVLILCAVRVSGIWKLRIAAALMPVAAILLLLFVTWFGPTELHDNIVGRFQISGRNLIDLPWTAWLGIPANVSMDAGYGYIIQRTGILICALLWFAFGVLPLADDQARRFHFNVAIYASLNLCISGSSLFSLKTTAVLWFLLGTVVAHRTLTEALRVVPRPSSSLATVP